MTDEKEHVNGAVWFAIRFTGAVLLVSVLTLLGSAAVVELGRGLLKLAGWW